MQQVQNQRSIARITFFSCPAINYTPRVAIITALMVCMRFSASSKTLDCSGSEYLVRYLHIGDAETFAHLSADFGL